MKIVECVPNFSEGRDKKVLDAISSEICTVDGVKLLDVDPGAATNRTVFTIAGEPDKVVEAAFLAIKKASELIDMRRHKGAHPRMGATDVCPFVPVSGVTMEECAELARKLGKRVGEELNIPVYLYEYAASSPHRRSLADIRSGEYEGFAEKIKKPEWKPDFGPAKFNEKSGATVIGARQFLVAYNVNLNTTSVNIAKNIAFKIREKGRIKRDKDGKKVTDKDGKTVYAPGLFKHCRATGWLIPEYNCAQVTINLTDFNITSIYDVFDACCKEAENNGARVTGSEIVGMVPKKALLDAGYHYLVKQKVTCGIPESSIIQTAIRSLGLNDVASFDPEKKIIEFQFKKPTPLASMTLKDFSDLLSTNAPAPGGGSVAALAGTLSSGLSSMVAALTYGRKGFEDFNEEMQKTGCESQECLREQLAAIDEDTEAFNQVMACFGMPKSSDEEKNARALAIQEATKRATLVPLHVLEKAVSSLKNAMIVAKHGYENSLSDAGVAGASGFTSAIGAYYNVLINLVQIEDASWAKEIRTRANALIQEARKIAAEVEKIVLNKLEG